MDIHTDEEMIDDTGVGISIDETEWRDVQKRDEKISKESEGVGEEDDDWGEMDSPKSPIKINEDNKKESSQQSNQVNVEWSSFDEKIEMSSTAIKQSIEDRGEEENELSTAKPSVTLDNNDDWGDFNDMTSSTNVLTHKEEEDEDWGDFNNDKVDNSGRGGVDKIFEIACMNTLEVQSEVRELLRSLHSKEGEVKLHRVVRDLFTTNKSLDNGMNNVDLQEKYKTISDYLEEYVSSVNNIGKPQYFLMYFKENNYMLTFSISPSYLHFDTMYLIGVMLTSNSIERNIYNFDIPDYENSKIKNNFCKIKESLLSNNDTKKIPKVQSLKEKSEVSFHLGGSSSLFDLSMNDNAKLDIPRYIYYIYIYIIYIIYVKGLCFISSLYIFYSSPPISSFFTLNNSTAVNYSTGILIH